MPETFPTAAPAGFVPQFAIAYTGDNGTAVTVDTAHPLPTVSAMAAASSTVLAGTSAATETVGPFLPQLGRAIWLGLSGTWTGTVTVQRSTDGGVTRLPLTVAGQGWASFTANANEPVAEETVVGATYYLALAIATGTLTYRVAQ